MVSLLWLWGLGFCSWMVPQFLLKIQRDVVFMPVHRVTVP